MNENEKIKILIEEFKHKFGLSLIVMMLFGILVGYILIVAHGHLLIGIILMIGIILLGHHFLMKIKKEYMQKIAEIEKEENETKGC